MRMNTTTRGNGGAWAGALIAIVLETYRVRAHHRRRGDASGGSGVASSDRGNGIGQGATKPTDIPKEGWWAILKRTWAEMSEDNVSMLAGGVAFFAMLSIFPALTAMVSLYGLVADPGTVERQVAAMGTVLPPEALQIISGWLGGFNLQALALTLGLVLFGILALVFVAVV